MKKIFSYSLFEPKIMPPHRGEWDKWANDNLRYWFNIPAILIINKKLYPDYENVLYVSPNIWNNKLSEIFKIFDNLRVEIIEREYNLTEPAIWRMIPLWERNISTLYPRDLDSLTSEEEYKFIHLFEQKDFLVGTIRSHENHSGHICRMLAGLCSFKPNKISPAIKGINFDFYYSQRRNYYGSDQELLIKIFTMDPDFTKQYFLDCKIDRQFNLQDFPCIEADLNEIEVDQNKKKILTKIKHFTNTSWLGEPCDSRGNLLNYLLQDEQEIKQKIKSSQILSNFYMIL